MRSYFVETEWFSSDDDTMLRDRITVRTRGSRGSYSRNTVEFGDEARFRVFCRMGDTVMLNRMFSLADLSM